MKRSFAVNINGRIYNIDEDAYNLLNEYLTQLRQTFASDDEREIVDDIEARINEHFDETIGPDNIITLENVNAVIAVMGRPEELSDGKSEDVATPPPYNPNKVCAPSPTGQKKLYRRLDNKVFGGVLSGFANYLGWNVVIMRILFVVLAICNIIGLGTLCVIYLICWMVIPPANTPRRRLEMMGYPVTPDNIARTFTCETAGTPGLDVPDKRNAAVSIGNVLLKCVVGFFSFLAGCVGFGTIVAALMCFGFALGLNFMSVADMNEMFDFDMNLSAVSPGFGLTGAGLIMLCIALPAILITWAGSTMIIGVKSPTKSVVISFIIIEVVMIIAACILICIFKSCNPGLLHVVSPAVASIPVAMH